MTTEPRPGPIVVGVEANAGSRTASKKAAQEARCHDAPL